LFKAIALANEHFHHVSDVALKPELGADMYIPPRDEGVLHHIRLHH